MNGLYFILFLLVIPDNLSVCHVMEFSAIHQYETVSFILLDPIRTLNLLPNSELFHLHHHRQFFFNVICPHQEHPPSSQLPVKHQQRRVLPFRSVLSLLKRWFLFSLNVVAMRGGSWTPFLWFLCCSDTVLSNLEPLEGVSFDVTSLAGFQSHHLDALVKLAFMKDARTRTDSCSSHRGASRDQQDRDASTGAY